MLCSGSTLLPHVNANGFWLVGRLLGMNLMQTLRTWTVIKTLVGVCGFALSASIYLLAA
ncbi:GntT/GntP/DsdX family permease [Streptomyces scopuliridis]|uniref:GntT/GntP/DsdX family permease n=1 Tax=Streptomyces scopuliridis TaxID=452529 RepID=UPI003421CAD5